MTEPASHWYVVWGLIQNSLKCVGVFRLITMGIRLGPCPEGAVPGAAVWTERKKKMLNRKPTKEKCNILKAHKTEHCGIRMFHHFNIRRKIQERKSVCCHSDQIQLLIVYYIK